MQGSICMLAKACAYRCVSGPLDSTVFMQDGRHQAGVEARGTGSKRHHWRLTTNVATPSGDPSAMAPTATAAAAAAPAAPPSAGATVTTTAGSRISSAMASRPGETHAMAADGGDHAWRMGRQVAGLTMWTGVTSVYVTLVQCRAKGTNDAPSGSSTPGRGTVSSSLLKSAEYCSAARGWSATCMHDSQKACLSFDTQCLWRQSVVVVSLFVASSITHQPPRVRRGVVREARCIVLDAQQWGVRRASREGVDVPRPPAGRYGGGCLLVAAD